MNLKYLEKCCIGRSKDKFTLEQVDIISPYISGSFFTKLKQLKPKKVFILTDAGCSSKDINEIETILKNRLEEIKLSYCSGIVHIKAYLFHWKNNRTNKYRRLLLWGSSNATKGGFNYNSELFSWLLFTKIESASRKEIIKYFSNLKVSTVEVESVEVCVKKGLTIKFPKIKFYSAEDSTFDLWIQKGRLCHPFPNDPSFRHLRVKLLEKLSPTGELSEALQELNIGVNQQTTITYDYIRHNTDAFEDENDSDLENQEEDIPTWKSRYFIDTVYGFWTSEKCFKENRSYFHKSDTESRAKELSIIASANDKKRKKWRNKFIATIESISKNIPDPSRYFHFQDGKLDIERYRKQFDKQLARDLVRAQDPWFKHGYISGYDFPEVPPMREFSANWKEFINSFASSLFFEVNKAGTRSWLAQTIRDNTEITHYDETSESFLKQLRLNWSENKEDIETFYYSE